MRHIIALSDDGALVVAVVLYESAPLLNKRYKKSSAKARKVKIVVELWSLKIMCAERPLRKSRGSPGALMTTDPCIVPTSPTIVSTMANVLHRQTLARLDSS